MEPSIVVNADNGDDHFADLCPLGPTLGALLHQRVVHVLHASVVTMDGGVVAFLKHSGWGKSTVENAFCKTDEPLDVRGEQALHVFRVNRTNSRRY